MKNTTLCYLKKSNKYLMMLRNKKEDDPNEGKWIGIGGHFLDGESPEECVKREVLEETGLIIDETDFCGIVTFASDIYETEYMMLFSSDKFHFADGRELTVSDDSTIEDFPIQCSEGTLKWVPIKNLENLPLWEGDKVFLNMLQSHRKFFSLKLCYKGDSLSSVHLNGQPY